MKKLLLGMIALLTLQFANAQDAKSAASLYNEGLAKAKAKEYVEALNLMGQAIAAADPSKEADAKVIRLAKQNGTRAAYGAGAAHKKAGDLDASLAAFEKGIGYNPDYYTNYVGKAQVQEAKGSTEEAIKSYLMASTVAAKAEKADKAKNYADKAQNIIAVSSGKKDWAKTKACATAFLSVKEGAGANYYMAKALMGSGDASGALSYIDKAVSTGASADLDKYNMLKGETHAKLGQKDSAIAAYKKVVGAKYGASAKYKVTELGG